MARELAHQAVVGYAYWQQPEEQRGELLLCRPATLQRLLPYLQARRRALLLTLCDESGLTLARQAREGHWTVVYDCLDFWREFEAEWYTVPREIEMVALADLVVASARKLEQWVELLGAKRTAYLPNAASPACWPPAPDRPPDLRPGALTLLYSGWLGGSWFAWDLLREVARYGEARDWQIYLIGEPTTRRIRRSNVHFLGPKPYPDLGAYLHHSDVCLIPFVTNLLTQCVSPLKVFDYVAAGKPVVSTPLPELEGLPYCWQAARPRDFCRAIEAAVATPADPAALARFRAEHTFAQRVATLRQLVFPSP
jgi:glycosyltransferase involved in cell wall biosynthesis